jgi:hypothetical protein
MLKDAEMENKFSRIRVMGPVGRRIMMGCGEHKVKKIPDTPFIIKYCWTPMYPLVEDCKCDPRAIVEKTVAKNINEEADMVLCDRESE